MNWIRKRIRARLKGLRTIIFNVLSTIMPVLEMSEVTDILPDTWIAPYAIAIAVINMWLRSITTTPVGKS